MADRIVLEARSRTVTGKRVKRLRRHGLVPATVYGHGVQPQSIEVDARAFRSVHLAAGDARLIDLVISDQRPRPVLIQRTQVDPRRNLTMHVEFYQANLREKLTANVPIHIVGESPAARYGGIPLTLIDSVEIECLPTDLPEQLDVDISQLADMNDAIYVRDLPLDLSVIQVKTDPDEAVVKIAAPQTGLEPEAAAAAAEEDEESASAPE